MSPAAVITAVVALTMAAAFAIWRTRLGTGFQVAFLLRFELLMLLSPLLLALLSRKLPNVLGNMFELRRFSDGVWVALLAFGTVWYALALTVIVLDHAGERFRIGRPALAGSDTLIPFHAPRWFWDWCLLLYSIPAVVTVGWAALCSKSWHVAGGMLLGFAAAVVLAIVIDLSGILLGPPGIRADHRFILMLSSYPKVVSKPLLEWDPGKNLRLRFLRWLGPGYVDEGGRVNADMAITMIAFVATIGLYWASFQWGWDHLRKYGYTDVPALAYLEFLITFTLIVLGGTAFYFDRYRIPVGMFVVVWSIAWSNLADTNHYWVAYAPRAENNSQAGGSAKQDFPNGYDEWFAKYKDSPNMLHSTDGAPLAVVVCASGGGIEAAGWTAKVLSELRDAIPGFSSSIRLISSTSGGSVGSLYFVESLFYHRKDNLPDNAPLDDAYEASVKGSLEASAWGTANPDYARLLAPFMLWVWLGPGQSYTELDRGWALEQSWRFALHDPKHPSIETRLSGWRKLVSDGDLPGTVFNATLVETGQALLLSTVNIPVTDLPPAGTAGTRPRAIVFGQNSDQGADLSVITAARLSASFPYVSPVARGRYATLDTRIAEPLQGQHVADGGYYDNFGVTAAVEWIRDLLHRPGSQQNSRTPKIIVIMIEAFPEIPENGDLKSGGAWSSEVLGPVNAVLDARTATQLGRDSLELALLGKGAEVTPPKCSDPISVFRFTASHDGPLSWQLSEAETDEIQQDWNKPETQDELNQLKACIGH